MPWGGTWSGPGIAGFILNLMFLLSTLIVLGLGIIWLIRLVGRRPTLVYGKEDTLEIARRRLAAGEITIAEFEEIRNHLHR